MLVRPWLTRPTYRVFAIWRPSIRSATSQRPVQNARSGPYAALPWSARKQTAPCPLHAGFELGHPPIIRRRQPRVTTTCIKLDAVGACRWPFATCTDGQSSNSAPNAPFLLGTAQHLVLFFRFVPTHQSLNGKSYGFRSPKILEMALLRALGKLPEPKLTHEF